jgi:hypothetical protein
VPWLGQKKSPAPRFDALSRAGVKSA